MDREDQVLEIYSRNIDRDKKIRLLEELVLDVTNEMDAQDQNMHPEIQNNLSEGLRLARDYLRELHSI